MLRFCETGGGLLTKRQVRGNPGVASCQGGMDTGRENHATRMQL
jgi:hypothetical protein